MPILLSEVRSVAWRKAYLWDAMFVPASNPEVVRILHSEGFAGWVPAVTVEENLWTHEAFDFSAGPSSYKVPYRSSAFNVQMSFHDNEKGTIDRWLHHWVNSILFKPGLTVNYIEDSVCNLLIRKLNSKRQVIRISSYEVFPEGSGMFEGSSDSDSPIISVNFAVTKVNSQDLVVGGV